MKRIWNLGQVAAFALVLISAQGQSSDSPQITSSVFASGGGTSSGGGYTFTHTLGEAIAGSSSGGGYTLVSGFLGADAVQEEIPDLKLTSTLSPVVVTENIARN